MTKYNISRYILGCVCLFCLFSISAYGVTEEAPKEAPPEHSSAEKPFESPPENFTATPNEEPKTPEGDHFVHQLFNMLFSLATILVILLLVTWVLKRIMNTRTQQINTSSLIKIIESRSLTPKTAIYVLEINGHHIVIAESINGATLLNSREKDRQSKTPDFEKILHDKPDKP